MSREYYSLTDRNLSQEQIERGEFSMNFLDWRIFKIKRDGNRVKKPIVATIDAKLLKDSYTPDEVIDAMLKYLSTIYDSHECLQVKSKSYLTYPSWYSAFFENERPKDLPELSLIEPEFIVSSLNNENNDYRD